jgi:hypothetical protein
MGRTMTANEKALAKAIRTVFDLWHPSEAAHLARGLAKQGVGHPDTLTLDDYDRLGQCGDPHKALRQMFGERAS